MNPSPALGLFLHWLGGPASASFYVPLRPGKEMGLRNVLAGGFFSWIVAPSILALPVTRDLLGVLHQAPASSVLRAYILGVLWGLGGLVWTDHALFGNVPRHGSCPS